MHTRQVFYGLLVALAVLAAGCSPQAPGANQTGIPLPTPWPETQATDTPVSTLAPTVSPTPTPGCTQTSGVVRELSIYSTALQGSLPFNLYLPPCYDAAYAGGYAVLYLLHGQSYDQQQWIRLGVVEAADSLITSRQAAPFLIVMPLEADTFGHPFTSGYEQALVEDLIPWINQHAAACPQRACRAIGGLSRGGSWAVRLGFSYGELFGAIGAHSLPPFYGTDTHMPGWLAAIPEGELPRVWMDIGQSDPYLQPASAFETLLTRMDIPHEWHLNSGNHTEAYWSAHVEEYLRWYTQPWQAAEP